MTEPSSFIGRSAPRVDARAKVTGEARYPGDLEMPGMLHMKILFAERPHARILRLDTSHAEKHPGVVAVFTANDVPVNEYGLQQPDQPVLCGPAALARGNSAAQSPVDAGPSPFVDARVVRFVGDQIALVVAETEKAAEAARELIQVEFQDLPLVTDPIVAMTPNAPCIHPERGESNVCVHYKIRKGDLAAGFAQSAVLVESEYHTPFQEHAYLQPEAGLAYIDEQGRVAVQAGGQWTHSDRAQIAHALDLPQDRVRVIYPAIGGAFGGREDLSVQIVLALAAWKLRRPVKIIWSRRESIIGHGKRHPMTLRAKWGATRTGKLVAAEMELIADAGAYMYTTNKVLGNTTIVCTGPYSIPNVRIDTYGVYTNNPPTCAFRGFGAPQGIFVAEMQMNKLADALGMDPVSFRLQNALRDGDTLNVDTPPPPPVSIVQVIEAAANKFKWSETRTVNDDLSHLRRGVGFAAGFKNVGFSFGYRDNAWARIELYGADAIERAVLYHAGADVGQGAHTIFAQMVAEGLGISPDRVTLVASDTATSESAGSSSASRLTFMGGNAVHGAVERAMEKWRNEERPAIGEFKYRAPATTPFDKETGYSTPNFAYSYAAQAIEIELDTETGFVRVRRIVAADDVGNAINPQMIEGQIEGAVAMAQGYALQENFQVRDGQVLTDHLSTYLIPTVLDVPDVVESVIVQVPDENGPWGARGLGELPFLPTAPAILAAIHDAVGVWLNELPATPEKIVRASRETLR